MKQKVNALLQRAEDPIEALALLDNEYSEDLGRLRKHIVNVVTAEKRLHFEALRLREQACVLERLAGERRRCGDEPAAVALYTQAARAREHGAEVENGYTSVCAQREELEAAGEDMRVRLETLRVRRQTARAQAVAARAVIAAREWLLPVNPSGRAREESFEQAREALLELRCRSQAFGELRSHV